MRNRLRHMRFFWMHRHARIDVLSIVTFDYWFKERDIYRRVSVDVIRMYQDFRCVSLLVLWSNGYYCSLSIESQ